jgi:hypothetical protein
MRRFIMLMLVVPALTVVNAYASISLTAPGFEESAAWGGQQSEIVANAAYTNTWWYGEGDVDPVDGPNLWILKNTPGYAAEGNNCAGVMDGEGLSGGLMQIVPISDETQLSISFQYLLWFGDYAASTGSYAVYGFKEDDIIDLGISGPGIGKEILSGDLDGDVYYGFGPPMDNYNTTADSIDIEQGEYQYIGVWFQYEIFGGSFYVDNVQLNITPAPEPGTLGLLGLGSGVLVLHRRRKRNR